MKKFVLTSVAVLFSAQLAFASPVNDLDDFDDVQQAIGSAIGTAAATSAANNGAGITSAVTASLSNGSVFSIAGLTPAQIAALTPAQIAGLTAAEIAAMTPMQIAALSAAQIAALSPAQFAALTPAQILAVAPAATGTTVADVNALLASMPTAAGDEQTEASIAAVATVVATLNSSDNGEVADFAFDDE